VGGTDPIPGIGAGGYPWAYYGVGLPSTLANGATDYTDQGGHFWTSDTSIFDSTAHTYTGSGSGTHLGPTIKANGLYRWTITLVTDPSITGPCVVNFDRNDFGFSKPWGSPNHMQDGIVWFGILTGNDGSGTGVGQIFAVYNNTGSNFSTGLGGSILIEQISTFVPDGGFYPSLF
jgi:hypothetical protein